MNKAVYDTRFFTEFYHSKDPTLLEKNRKEKSRREKYVSAIVIHELYKLSLANEGRETTKLKVTFLKQEFKIIPVDSQIAEISAELSQKYKLPMGDSMNAAAALSLNAFAFQMIPTLVKSKK
jgi:predicted nucleic acid-binding protein